MQRSCRRMATQCFLVIIRKLYMILKNVFRSIVMLRIMTALHIALWRSKDRELYIKKMTVCKVFLINKLVEHYVWNEGKVPENEMIHYQYYSTHNKQFRDVAKQKGLEDYIDGIQASVQRNMCIV